jgi:hypothetical protein
MMRKYSESKIKKNSSKPGNKFLIRKLSMTDRLKIRSVRSRNVIIKGQSRKSII